MNRTGPKPGMVHAKPSVLSRTGVLGVGFTEFLRDGKPVRYFTAFAGRYVRKFNIVRLGRSEAFRRAVQFRAEFEMKAKGATT